MYSHNVFTIAPLKYDVVMLLNRSWPAVSHICSFTLLPYNSTVLILKSIPEIKKSVLKLRNLYSKGGGGHIDLTASSATHCTEESSLVSKPPDCS